MAILLFELFHNSYEIRNGRVKGYSIIYIYNIYQSNVTIFASVEMR